MSNKPAAEGPERKIQDTRDKNAQAPYILNVSCCLCPEKHTVEVKLPDKWCSRYDGTQDENGFCPKHSEIADFAQSQCPGCVGSWGDCPLWESFAYTHKRSITPVDLNHIANGICPKRINGTSCYKFGEGNHEQLNLSKPAPGFSGMAFAKAIRVYCSDYPLDKN